MSALLNLNNLNAYYGAAHILHDLSLQVNAGERVALIGRNGVGKTTVVNTILGLATLRNGSVELEGKSYTKLRAYMAAQHGVAVVPQGRCIVANLSVEENLLLGAAVGRKGPWSVKEIYKIFPILEERAHTPGTALSGGAATNVGRGPRVDGQPVFDFVG
jgi:branched-chain amino acid transport system ATP-binding protein